MRITHPISARKPPPIPMAGDESQPNIYRVLVDRCLSLEAAQAKLKEQLDELVHEKDIKASFEAPEEAEDPVTENSNSWGAYLPGYYASGTPYRRILDMMGHAVYVCSASTGEITFW